MAEVKRIWIKPPHIALLLLLLSWAARRFVPQFNVVNQPYRNIGIFVFAFGLSLLFWSFYMFRKNKTPVVPGQKPTFVVAEGPYKFTRNPMYFGVTIALFGASIYFGNILSFLSPIIFILIMNFYFIPFEERLMESLFGKKYLDYKKSTRRWI